MTAPARRETDSPALRQALAIVDETAGPWAHQVAKLIRLHIATPTPPRDDAGVEDALHAIAELELACIQVGISGEDYWQRTRVTWRERLEAHLRAARQRIAALEGAAANVVLAFHDYPEPRPLTEVAIRERGAALSALADAITTPAAPGGATE